MPESQITAVSQSPDEQLQQLRMYLATSEPFRHCRGNFGNGWTGTGMFEELKDASPTAILEQLDRRNSLARVLMNHLAKLRRDGHLTAFAELSKALTDANFVITGEELPLHKRTSGVLLMYYPKWMLDMIKWLKLVSPEIVAWQLGHPARHTQDFIQKGHIKDRPGFLSWTQQILAENPEFKTGLEKFYASSPYPSESHRGNFLPDSLLPDYLATFPKDEPARNKLRYGVKWLRVEEDQRYVNTDVIGNWGVACFLPEMTQQDVLSLIKREHQDEVATWQFHYPAHIRNLSGHNASIGLFPEKEFDRFSKLWPSFMSGSISHGMGAVLMEHRWGQHDMVDPLFDINHWRNQETEPDKNEVGLKLHFPQFD